MPSSKPFAQADWDHDIEVFRDVSATEIDQETFQPVGGVPTTPNHTVEGHFDPNPQENEFKRDGGVVVEGEGRLFTEDDVQRDDRLRIHFDDTGNNFQWYVVREVIREHRVLSRLLGLDVARKEFRLMREMQ